MTEAERNEANLRELLTTAPEYDGLRQHVERSGFFWTFRPAHEEDGRRYGPYLTCASKELPGGRGLTGCSFSVASRRGAWYILTWSPRIYRIPERDSVGELCIEFLRFTERTPYDVPDALKASFGLVELTEADFDGLEPDGVN